MKETRKKAEDLDEVADRLQKRHEWAAAVDQPQLFSPLLLILFPPSDLVQKQCPSMRCYESFKNMSSHPNWTQFESRTAASPNNGDRVQQPSP